MTRYNYPESPTVIGAQSTGHSWKTYDPETVACSLCGAEPWTLHGRQLCPVTHRVTPQTPTAEPLTCDDLEPLTCTNPQCRTLDGIARGTIEFMNELLERGYGASSSEMIDRLAELTQKHWREQGVQS